MSRAYPVARAGQPAGQAGGARDLQSTVDVPSTYSRDRAHCTHKDGLAHARPNYNVMLIPNCGISCL